MAITGFAPVLVTAAWLTLLSPAQSQETSPTLAPSPSATMSSGSTPSAAGGQTAASGQPNEAEMMKRMMELAKLNENHKLLADLVGTWSYTVKMWMNPDASAPPSESKGTAVKKPIMNGRYFTMDVSGKMQMPGPDGKIKDMDFKGTSIEGYDNVKQKFVSTWADNMSTGIMMSEGTYDPAEKTFTYNAEMEMIPGMKQKVREVVKIADKDHHTFEWYEDRSGKQAKTMEINYTRKK